MKVTININTGDVGNICQRLIYFARRPDASKTERLCAVYLSQKIMETSLKHLVAGKKAFSMAFLLHYAEVLRQAIGGDEYLMVYVHSIAQIVDSELFRYAYHGANAIDAPPSGATLPPVTNHEDY